MFLLSAVKNRILPGGLTPRRLPLGIGRGIVLPVDFHYQTKQYLGLAEYEVKGHLQALCAHAGRSFDVGVQHGYYALLIAHLSGGKVAAFDADERYCELLRKSIRLNPGLEIEPVVAHVGNGEDDLRLDDFAEEWGFPDFLKIDVDGGELSVLQSAERLLARHPGLIVETHSENLERSCAELLLDHGYKPLVVTQRRFFKETRPIPHNHWLVAYPNRKQSRAAARSAAV